MSSKTRTLQREFARRRMIEKGHKHINKKYPVKNNKGKYVGQSTYSLFSDTWRSYLNYKIIRKILKKA